MGRPDLSLPPIPSSFQRLTTWLSPQMPEKLIHRHEKISDAQWVAVAVLQHLHKAVYFSRWWAMLKTNFFPWFPSEVQARVRLERLTPVIERVSVEVEQLDFNVIDSAPLPTCIFKRAKRCKFPGAAYGLSTAGMVYGDKGHAWTTLNGKITKYKLHPTNVHDFVVGCEMNLDWPAYGRSGVLMGVRSRRQGQSKLGTRAINLERTAHRRKRMPRRRTRVGRKSTLPPARSSNRPSPFSWARGCAGGRSKPS